MDAPVQLSNVPRPKPKIAPPAGATLDRVSSYMRLGLHVAGLGFGRDFAGEKKEIIRSLFEHAPSFGLGEGKLTGPVAGYLATILREPDAQGGKRNRGKGKG